MYNETNNRANGLDSLLDNIALVILGAVGVAFAAMIAWEMVVTFNGYCL